MDNNPMMTKMKTKNLMRNQKRKKMLIKNHRQKNKKQLPKKTKAVVHVKSEEKVQLENDIAKTIKTFDTAIDKLKKEINYDEDKSERSAIEEQMSNILTC